MEILGICLILNGKYSVYFDNGRSFVPGDTTETPVIFCNDHTQIPKVLNTRWLNDNYTNKAT